MKKFLAAFAITALAGGSAIAADLPFKAPPPPAPLVATWTGTYIGLNGGWGSGTSRQTAPSVGVTTGDYDISGGLFGVTYGGNWQMGHAVLGFEGDFDWAHINGTVTNAACGGTCFTNTRSRSTERMRAGWDFNGWLLYGTLGAAFANVKAGQVGCGGPGFCGQGTRAGWVGGVGVEKMFWRNWSAKLEYLHYDLGSSIMMNPALPITVLDRGDIVRAGINYHFDIMGFLHLN